MKKYKGVAGQILYCYRDNILCTRQARMPVSHESFGLKTSCAQPLIHEGETNATVIILAVPDSNCLLILYDSAMLRHSVGNSGDKFGEMKRRIGIVTNSE